MGNKRSITLLMGALLCVMALGVYAGLVAAQGTVGSVKEVAGQAHVQRAGRTIAVTQGMAVELHDTITTEAGAHLTIVLADNSQLQLSERSSIVLTEALVGAGGTRQSTTIGLLGGKLDSLVSTALRGAAPNFKVETPNAIAGVRGTHFSVAYAKRSSTCGNGPSTDVAVRTGRVIVSSRANPTASVEVDAGYETVVCLDRGPLPPGPLGVAGMNGPFGSVAGFSNAGPGAGAPPPVCPVCPPSQ